MRTAERRKKGRRLADPGEVGIPDLHDQRFVPAPRLRAVALVKVAELVHPGREAGSVLLNVAGVIVRRSADENPTRAPLPRSLHDLAPVRVAGLGDAAEV